MPNSTSRPFTATVILAVCLLTTAVQASEQSQEPGWAKSHQTNGWCFRGNLHRSCLPADFRLQRFESGHATWALDDGESIVIYLWYDAPSIMHAGEDGILAETGNPSHDLEIISTKKFGAVGVFELTTDVSQPNGDATSVFVVEFREGFSLTFFSQPSETERMRDIAETVADEWHESGSQEARPD